MTDPTSARAQSEAITPERLKELLAAATPGPWFVVEDDRPGMEWNRHICWDQHGDHRVAFMASDGTEANATLMALSPALAARVIELERERDALRLAGKHLAIKLAEFYRMGSVSPAECQAMRDWMALMPAPTALETPNAE